MNCPLPNDIVDNVLSRLPVESVIRFKCVSRSWQKLLSSSYFVDKHIKQNKYGVKKIMVTPEKMYSLDENGKACHEQGVGVSEVKDYCVVWGSCDGLVCIGHPRHQSQLCLWNPSTGKYKYIRDYPVLGDRSWVMHGFGYNAATDDYQIITIHDFLDIPRYSQVSIYSLRNTTWKTLQENNSYIIYKGQKGTLINGSLHWIAIAVDEEYKLQSFTIIAFDISLEKLFEVPQGKNPIVFDNNSGTIDITELDGKLGAFYVYSTSFELWVMKDYSVRESWSMLFDIIDPTNDIKVCGVLPKCSIKESRALVFCYYKKLFLYDLKAQTAIPVENFQIPVEVLYDFYFATFYVESLLALD